MPSNWRELEEHVQRVYSTLLNLKDEGVVVARDVHISGRNGSAHQFDVYYEFSRAGVTHRVAIECKNRGRAIEKDLVGAFKAKVDDIPGLQGVSDPPRSRLNA